MTASRNIAVVICHGSYHTPAPYGPFNSALEAQGFEAYCPQRPTCDLANLNVGDINNPDFDREPPAGGYPSDTEDVEVVTKLLSQLINNEEKQVLVVAHSSGGWVATQAAVPELQATTRKHQGKTGGIIGLFYYGAFVIPVGVSVNSFFQPKEGEPPAYPPFLRFYKHGLSGLGTIANPAHFMFNDLDPEEGKRWGSTLTAAPVMSTPLTNDAYSVLPCAYVVLDNDLSLPKEYQEMMVGLQSQQGTSFTMYNAPAGHSPHLSWTGGLVGQVVGFVDKIGMDKGRGFLTC
ncbi:Alpha/beta hydrolase fold-1 [Aspergillus cavernicola]|uniref:Alpha/beta hydrolase fold-1 n=1 Tax=Aspergillus cavernicola TaxID=176166 RepID=A0ABR4HH92_9EURO